MSNKSVSTVSPNLILGFLKFLTLVSFPARIVTFKLMSKGLRGEYGALSIGLLGSAQAWALYTANLTFDHIEPSSPSLGSFHLYQQVESRRDEQRLRIGGTLTRRDRVDIAQ